MFCNNCGTQLPDGALFCPNCGNKFETVNTPQPEYQQPEFQQPAYQEPTYTQPAPQNNGDDTSILVFGILALAIGAIFGIIFGAIALNKANDWVARGGQLIGKAKAGRILGKIGLILGIISTAILAIYIIIIAIIGVGLTTSYYY